MNTTCALLQSCRHTNSPFALQCQIFYSFNSFWRASNNSHFGETPFFLFDAASRIPTARTQSSCSRNADTRSICCTSFLVKVPLMWKLFYNLSVYHQEVCTPIIIWRLRTYWFHSCISVKLRSIKQSYYVYNQLSSFLIKMHDLYCYQRVIKQEQLLM